MTQTQKAKEASQNSQNGNNQELTPQMQAALAQLVKPLQEQIAALSAEKEAAKKKAKEEAEALRKQQLADGADITKILAEADSDSQVEDKFEKMSNRQLVEIISKAVEGGLAAQAETLKSEMSKISAPGGEKIQQLEKVLMQIVGHQAAAEARGKYKDFDDFLPQINEVMNQISGIGFDEAYLIAKGREKSKVPPSGQTDTEKPADFGVMPTGPNAIVGGVIPNQNMLQTMADRGNASRAGFDASKSGVAGYRNILNQGIEDTLAEKQ